MKRLLLGIAEALTHWMLSETYAELTGAKWLHVQR